MPASLSTAPSSSPAPRSAYWWPTPEAAELAADVALAAARAELAAALHAAHRAGWGSNILTDIRAALTAVAFLATEAK